MDILYHIVGWNIITLLQILEPKKGTIITEIQSGEETVEFLPQENGDDKPSGMK
jgi:hypothetical protein